MAAGPTVLSIAGAVIYLGVSALCMLAWANSGKAAAELDRGRSAWLAIASGFVLLALSRIFVFEDRLDDRLRDIARQSDIYEGRVAWQAPLSVLAIVGLAFLFAMLARTLTIASGDPHRRARAIALLAGLAMIGLIALRIISFHPIDALLYGTLRLNWWLDIGLSAIVGWAALWSFRADNARLR